MSGARRVVWRAIVGVAAVIAVLFLALMVAFGSGYVRNFYTPAEAMAPTLEKGDRFVALMDGSGDLKRGDIVLLTVGEAIGVKRVAALAGDTVRLEEGVVILNGRPVAQRFLAAEQRSGYSGPERASRLAEQLPGEAAPHEILDLGVSPVDDIPEVKIPAGFVFLLGDNRDRSADSRVARVQDGLELVPLADVKGRPLFCIMGCELGR